MFKREFITFDDTINEEIKLKSKAIYVLDTENTNYQDKEQITYSTQLRKIVTYDDVVKKPERKKEMGGYNVNVFTHPLNFWNYILKTSYQKIDIYCFNADYDVKNLFGFLFILYHDLKEKETQFEIDSYGILHETKNSKISKSPFTYKFVKTNDSIIQLSIILEQLECKGNKKEFREINIIDLAKRVTGSLADNVKSFLGYEMDKKGLDYSIFRDYGHIDYTEEELRYLWEDVYYLGELTKLCLFELNMNKLTCGSNALEKLKEQTYNDFCNNWNNENCSAFKVYNRLFNNRYNYYKRINEKETKTKSEMKALDSYLKWCKSDDLEINENLPLSINGILKSYSPSTLFKKLFPQLNKESFDYCFKGYHGGMTRFNDWVVPDKFIKQYGQSYDINSSFPHSMATKLLPYGEPKFKEGEFKTRFNKVAICRIKVSDFYLRPNYEPCISSNDNDVFSETDWIKEYTGTLELIMSSPKLEYFKKAYNYTSIEYVDYYEFNATVGLLTKFITDEYHTKQTSTGAKKAVSKLTMNSSYGKFGQNNKTELRKSHYNEELNRIDSEIVKNSDGSPVLTSMNQVYLPVAIFITDYSRLKLINKLIDINRTKGCKWVYCDTDSVYIVGNESAIIKAMGNDRDKNNSGDLGLWKLEHTFNKIKIIGIKKYVVYDIDGSIKVTLSGINKKYFDIIADEYKRGIDSVRIISKEDSELIHEGKYYFKIDTNENYYPHLYYDKECTQIIPGGFKAIRKINVKNGVILKNSFYCVSGGKF